MLIQSPLSVYRDTILNRAGRQPTYTLRREVLWYAKLHENILKRGFTAILETMAMEQIAQLLTDM